MDCFPGKNLDFSWLHCALLFLFVLFGSVLLSHFQKWPGTAAEFFEGHKGDYHTLSLRSIQCLENEFLDTESNICQKCPRCPYGYKLNKACGNGLGAGATCSHCISTYYQRDGECYPCKYCQGRETLQECTNTSNTKCSSECLEGYYMSVTRQCIPRSNQRHRPADPPQKTPSPVTSKLSMQTATIANKIVGIISASPPNNDQVQNGEDEEPVFPEPKTTSPVNRQETGGSPTWSWWSLWSLFSVPFFVLVLIVVIGCALKRNFISATCLKDQFQGLCCCKKIVQSDEKDLELNLTENIPPGTTVQRSEIGLQTPTHPLLTSGDTDSVKENMSIIESGEDIEDDAFLPNTENEEERRNDPEIQKRSDDRDKEMQLRFASVVMFISGALNKENLENFKSYLIIAIGDDFSENDKESAESFDKIATLLQQRLVCSWSNTGVLIRGLESINRPDLAQKLKVLDKSEKSDQTRRLRRSSSRQD